MRFLRLFHKNFSYFFQQIHGRIQQDKQTDKQTYGLEHATHADRPRRPTEPAWVA